MISEFLSPTILWIGGCFLCCLLGVGLWTFWRSVEPKVYVSVVESLLTPAEQLFYRSLDLAIAGRLQILCKVRLADLFQVASNDSKERHRLFRKIAAKQTTFRAKDLDGVFDHRLPRRSANQCDEAWYGRSPTSHMAYLVRTSANIVIAQPDRELAGAPQCKLRSLCCDDRLIIFPHAGHYCPRRPLGQGGSSDAGPLIASASPRLAFCV